MSGKPCAASESRPAAFEIDNLLSSNVLSPLGLAQAKPAPIQTFSLETLNERQMINFGAQLKTMPSDCEENPRIKQLSADLLMENGRRSSKSASSANLLASTADNKTASPSLQNGAVGEVKRTVKDLFPKPTLQGSEKSASRSRSVDKASTSSIKASNILDASPVLDNQFASAGKPPKDHSVFLDGEQPIIRTRVLTRGSDKSKIPLLPDDPEERSTYLRSHSRRELQEDQDLGQILQQFVQAEESLSLTGAEDDLDDYDRMSEDVRRQMSQIRDEIVVDVDPDDEQARAAHEAQVARAANQPGEEQSIFKRVSYFASVAASAGFLLLMRRHNVL